MTLPRWLPWALLALAVAFGGVTRRDATFARGEARRLERVVDSLARQTARVDVVYRDSLVPVYKGWRERWDTTRVATLERAMDSLRALGVASPETTTVGVPLTILATADSTIQACSAALLTCDERVRLRDARFDAAAGQWRAERAVLTARVPTLTDKLRTAALWSGVGALAVTVLRR